MLAIATLCTASTGSASVAAQEPAAQTAPVAAVAAQAPPAAQAPAGATLPASGAPPYVYLLTMGPGSLVYDVWGHNALWIRDPERGLDVTYNWGMFSFDQEGFLPRLAKGEMLYWMMGIPASRLLQEYVAQNRSIWAQQVNLTAAQKEELIQLLLETDTEENRYYRYDYYRDNCSTRVRDALDRVLDGRIRETLGDEPAGVTWRWHARRILRRMPWAYVGMEFALGNPADVEITRWDEGFLPLLLMEHLKDVTVVGEDGREAPLVGPAVQLFQAAREPEPAEPPFWLPWFLAAGVLVGGLIAAPVVPRVLAGGVATGWSLVAGTAGVLLLMAWLFTDHAFWFRNENLLQVSPFSLLLGLLLVGGHFRPGERVRRWIMGAALLVLALSAAGLLLQALPGFDQVNGEVIAFAFPVHAGVAALARRLGREGPRPGGR